MLFWFNLYSGYSGATHVDSLFLMGQHVLFTAFPPIVNGILDKDLSAETLKMYPELYKVGPEGKVFIIQFHYLSVLCYSDLLYT